MIRLGNKSFNKSTLTPSCKTAGNPLAEGEWIEFMIFLINTSVQYHSMNAIKNT